MTATFGSLLKTNLLHEVMPPNLPFHLRRFTVRNAMNLAESMQAGQTTSIIIGFSSAFDVRQRTIGA
jgi:hypothetical protein